MNKRYLSTALIGAMLLSSVSMTAMASSPITVTVNGQNVTFSDQSPEIKNGVTYVPVRGVFEKLGATVAYQTATKGIQISADNVSVAFQVGSDIASITKGGSTTSVKLGGRAYVAHDRTMVPVRFATEALGGSVSWNGNSNTVNITSKSASNTPTATTVDLKVGSVKVYDFGSVKLHAYNPKDNMGDECYLLESKSAVVLLESPAFVNNLNAWSAYIQKIGKPVAGALLAYHPNGVEHYGNVPVYATQNALKNWGEGGGIHALNDNFVKLFGTSFDATMPSDATIVKEGSTVTIGGINFDIIASGDDAYSVDIPAINCVYRHMMGSDCHNILASTQHIDATIAELQGYQKKNYSLVLTGHHEPEGQNAVTTKIAYLEKTKELAKRYTSAKDFIVAMKAAFPGYSGENYLEMTAGYLYPASKDETAIRNVLTSYRNALANSSPKEVAAKYTVDGVVMGPGSPTAIGEQLQPTYSSIFSQVGLNLDFTLANIIIGEKYAFVQSTSDGTALINATGKTAPEQNRELFVLEKVNGEWKIARYMYNKMDVLVAAKSADVVQNTSTGSTAEDNAQVRKLISTTYHDALAASNADAIINTFTSNGVVLPPNAPTYRGAQAVKGNYEGIFKAVSLNLQFNIDEIVLDGDYGFVRSTSNGTATVLATGKSGPEVNRELFVVHKENGAWKIAFYMYNKMS